MEFDQIKCLENIFRTLSYMSNHWYKTQEVLFEKMK